MICFPKWVLTLDIDIFIQFYPILVHVIINQKLKGKLKQFKTTVLPFLKKMKDHADSLVVKREKGISMSGKST